MVYVLKNEANKYILITTILLQSVLIILSNVAILGATSLDRLKSNIIVFNILIIIATFLVFLSLKQVTYYHQRNVELKTLKCNMSQIEELINLLRSERHEYLTHMQSIGALTYLEEYEELKEYLKEISFEYRQTNELIRVGNPALTALINTKKEIATKKGILLYVKCHKKINSSLIRTWELCSLLSNLIENAMESCISSEDNRWIKVIIDSTESDLVFKIENFGKIEEHIAPKIFNPGFTSKDSAGRGFGLYICKNIVDKYKGTLEFENTDSGTVQFIVTLPKGDIAYDKKIS